MGGIKPFLVLPVAPFCFAIVSWCKRAYQLVSYAMLFQVYLEKGRLVRTAIGAETFGKFLPIVGLNTFNGEWERLYQVFQKCCRGIGTVFFKSFHESPSGIFVNGSILVEMLPFGFVYKADGRNKLHIYLDTLSRTLHWFIRSGNILGIGRFDSHDVVSAQEPVQTGNRACISMLPEFNPENNEASMRIPSTHICNELDFLGGMLVRVVVGSTGTITQRVNGAIITTFPAINIQYTDGLSYI